MPNNVWAIYARSGHPVWHYTHPPSQVRTLGTAVGIYKESVFFATPDSHLLSLNSKTGALQWNVVIADYTRGNWTTMAPLVVGDHVLVGVSGDFDNLRGFLCSTDPATGKTQWTWYSTPPHATPNATTGDMTWMTGTCDPELKMIYWGTGNPTSVLNGTTRPGDDLYTRMAASTLSVAATA